MADKGEIEHLRTVLDYLPCADCEENISGEERSYLCTICQRISRSVVAEITVPRWRARDGEVVAVDGRDINELRPDVTIYADTEEEEEAPILEALEILEIGVDVPVEIEEGIEEDKQLPEWKTVDEGAYIHGEYTLYTKEAILRGGRKQRIYFFSKKEKQDAEPCAMPKGYTIKVNEKTGLPVLKKAKQ